MRLHSAAHVMAFLQPTDILLNLDPLSCFFRFFFRRQHRPFCGPLLYGSVTAMAFIALDIFTCKNNLCTALNSCSAAVSVPRMGRSTIQKQLSEEKLGMKFSCSYTLNQYVEVNFYLKLPSKIWQVIGQVKYCVAYHTTEKRKSQVVT
jgi:hypothetical protein